MNNRVYIRFNNRDIYPQHFIKDFFKLDAETPVSDKQYIKAGNWLTELLRFDDATHLSSMNDCVKYRNSLEIKDGRKRFRGHPYAVSFYSDGTLRIEIEKDSSRRRR
ncbi:hypothetical protein [Apilactobacillus xinyiensis]|uniref:hypothetical protein n=1 Tax=Apilactobacillus xinyiensis TaxID=2841032 RepID=UPI002010A483|nr:hypothetical protein [Apilactobacillus xinyiensis]MCL0330586.1 hypothetical protein [Apilactobacillus xinyiensis]